jgi:hypothetical protein
VVELSEYVTFAVALLAVFGIGFVLGALKGFAFAWGVAQSIFPLAKRFAPGGAAKPGLWDVAMMLLGGKLGGLGGVKP